MNNNFGIRESKTIVFEDPVTARMQRVCTSFAVTHYHYHHDHYLKKAHRNDQDPITLRSPQTRRPVTGFCAALTSWLRRYYQETREDI